MMRKNALMEPIKRSPNGRNAGLLYRENGGKAMKCLKGLIRIFLALQNIRNGT